MFFNICLHGYISRSKARNLFIDGIPFSISYSFREIRENIIRPDLKNTDIRIYYNLCRFERLPQRFTRNRVLSLT